MKRGFSLVEILVVLAIMGLVGGFGLVYVRNLDAKQDLVSTKEEVVSALRLARSYAITQQRPEGYRDPLTSVVVVVNVDGISIYPNDKGNPPYVEKKLSESTVTISSDNFIIFKAFSGELLDGHPQKVTATSTVTGDSNTINVEPGGSIYE